MIRWPWKRNNDITDAFLARYKLEMERELGRETAAELFARLRRESGETTENWAESEGRWQS